MEVLIEKDFFAQIIVAQILKLVRAEILQDDRPKIRYIAPTMGLAQVRVGLYVGLTSFMNVVELWGQLFFYKRFYHILLKASTPLI